MTKPVGTVCNLACKYCYYLEKSNLYQDNSKHVMSDELLERFIKEYIKSQTTQNVMFTWHGARRWCIPSLSTRRPWNFRKSMQATISSTTAYRSTVHFLLMSGASSSRRTIFLVGISIDGPQEFHDEYRKNKAGHPSYLKVMKGLHLLNKHGMECHGSCQWLQCRLSSWVL